MKRLSGETWSLCCKQYEQLVHKWTSGCNSPEAVMDLINLDGVMKLIPRTICTFVKEHKPVVQLKQPS